MGTTPGLLDMKLALLRGSCTLAHCFVVRLREDAQPGSSLAPPKSKQTPAGGKSAREVSETSSSVPSQVPATHRPLEPRAQMDRGLRRTYW